MWQLQKVTSQLKVATIGPPKHIPLFIVLIVTVTREKVRAPIGTVNYVCVIVSVASLSTNSTLCGAFALDRYLTPAPPGSFPTFYLFLEVSS